VVGRLAAGNKDVVMWCAPTPGHAPLAAPAEVDVEWTAEHARQCARMLPGGLAVVGLYVVAPLASYVPAAASLPLLCLFTTTVRSLSAPGLVWT